jgi:hypothetical protein
MKTIAVVPRAMLEKKPPHGAPCNRCGLCCHASLCNLAQSIHGFKQGPCPELLFDENGSRCGLIARSEGKKRDAAKLLINTGNGCDMILHGEKIDHVYREMMDVLDFENQHRILAARKLWGVS